MGTVNYYNGFRHSKSGTQRVTPSVPDMCPRALPVPTYDASNQLFSFIVPTVPTVPT